ncbi:MAG TPA: TIGR00300 family protein [Vicinamibacterales bacterium]|jgi:lysine-ketoglutarate reductase/saccharopine dehydrogenase-like protein (TIGR00300 family)|nr:TIGR00300 family protein [Vicinamibacterales bacterium]
MSSPSYSEIVEANGHLIDSRLLTSVFDKVIERGARYEVLEFTIGRTNDEFSHLQLCVTAASREGLRELLEELMPLGCHPRPEREARLEEAGDGFVPDDFYSTTNHRTQIHHDGRWTDVEQQRMDAVVVVDQGHASCRMLRDVRPGDLVVCGVDGVRVSPEFQERDRLGFAFMTNDVSTERRVEVSVARVIRMMEEVKSDGGRIVVVAGPVVIHSGGGGYLSRLVRQGWVDGLLTGNALAVHDVEHALFGTSLGIDLDAGVAVDEGHKNHMRAINFICGVGGLGEAVRQGTLRSGLMHEVITQQVPYVLAGSIRDDGPLPDTVMDLIEAQARYAEILRDAKMVLMLSSMLHSIGVGNMLPAWVRVVCVDINPAVVTKLGDRGSSQTAGIVTDVGLFLHQLAAQIGDAIAPGGTRAAAPDAVATGGHDA